MNRLFITALACLICVSVVGQGFSPISLYLKSDTSLQKHKWNNNNRLPDSKWMVFTFENNDSYWENVNTSQLIVQLDIGSNIYETTISDFLKTYDFHQTRASLFPEIQNFIVFEGEALEKESVLVIARTLSSLNNVQFIKFLLNNYFE